MALWDKWYDEFPNTDFSQINLDWIIRKLRNHEISIQELFSQDIPTEVENVLNQWLDDGTLATLINDTLLNSIFAQLQLDIANGDNALKASKTWKCKTFADISLITDLDDGDTVTTAGFYTEDDGGGALYEINTSGGIPVTSTSFYAIPATNKARAWGLTGTAVETSLLQTAVTYSNSLNLEDLDIKIDNAILLHDDFKLYGNGAVITVTNYTSVSGAAVKADNCSNVVVDGIIFEGGAQTANYAAFRALNSTDVLINNCSFNNGLGYRVRLNGSVRPTVKNSVFNNLTGISGDPGGAIYMQGGSSAHFEHLVCNNFQDHVVYLDGTVEIARAIVDNIEAYNGGIAALTNAAVVVAYGNVHDFIIKSVIGRTVRSGVGIYERDDIFPARFHVSGCVIDASENCISVIGSAAHIGVKASGNIDGNMLTSSGQDAISVRFVASIMINGNTIRQSARNAIDITGGRRVMIVGNMIENSVYAIHIGARDTEEGVTSSYIWVHNNVATMGCTYGLVGGSTVTDMYSVGNMFAGISAANTVNIAATGASVLEPADGTRIFRSILFTNAAPSAGYHTAGDIAFDTTGSTKGWRCQVSGTPGTWVAN